MARKAEATWHALREAARRSALAHMDETGWKVEAQLHWLWAVVTEQITLCEILPGRGFADAAAILGAEYAGWLIHDGLQIYYKFLKAAHQSCVAHLIRRCRDLVAVATPAAARFPQAVKELLEQGLALRDRYLEQKIKGLASKILALSARQLPPDWQARYGHRPLLLETLVDANRFRGTCYRAANWIRMGQTTGRGRMDREHTAHGQAIKDIYVYPLVRDARQRLRGDPTR